MSRGIHAPMLLVALALPGAACAFGLGDIRVHSALNEPLSAQVDIIGATSEELQSLKAGIADADRFQSYNADRPSYLSTVIIRLATDAQGRPVLNLYSNAAFTDPVVELLVDVRWGRGELIRDFSLLLDPVEFKPVVAHDAMPVILQPVEVQPIIVPSIIVQPQVAIPVVVQRLPAHAARLDHVDDGASSYRVRPRDTLYGIVRHAGAATETDAQRMMIAVFRGNPDAFDGNINLLHRDALLALPSLASLAAMDAAQARRDVVEHMNAWRHGASVQAVAVAARRPPPVEVPAPNEIPAPNESQAPVRMLPTEDTTGKLPASSSVPAQLPVAATADVATPDLAATDVVTWKSAEPVPEAPAPVATPRAPQSTGFGLVLGLALLGLVLLGAVAILGRRLFAAVSARTRSGAHEPPAVADGHAVQATMPLLVVQEHAAERTIELPAAEDNPTVRLQATEDGTILMTESTARMERIRAEDTVEVTAEMAAAAGESTASLPADLATVLLEGMADDDTILDVGAIRSELARAQDTVLDYNLVDLDATAQHVHMPSDLNDRPTFVERRTNVVEALRAAIARDPSRTDLRLKLVETYFAAAATNRRAFAEFLRQQAADPNSLSAADWQKVAMMSQELGLDVALPNLESDDDLANCA